MYIWWTYRTSFVMRARYPVKADYHVVSKNVNMFDGACAEFVVVRL